MGFCSARRRRHAGDRSIAGLAARDERRAHCPRCHGPPRGSVSDRDKPPLNRRHRDTKSISVSLEFFAIVRLARAAPSRCSLGRMHNGEKIVSTAPE